MTRSPRSARRLRPDVVAVTLLAVLLVLAVGIGISGCTAPATRAPATAPASTSPAGRVAPLSSISVNGVTYPVPAALPADCRHAYVAIAPALMAARDGVKALLSGAEDVDEVKRVELAAAKLADDKASVTALLLDCQSQSVPVAQAYGDAVTAVDTLGITMRIANVGPYPIAARQGMESDLTRIELALAQPQEK